ncbi:MAG: glycosyltransferase family 39 protein, partial [Anaerolineae bacterium]
MRDRVYLWSLVLLLLVAMGLALWGIGAQSLWFDEGWSAYAAAQPNLVAAANADATNPPLYYALLHVTARLWGDSEFGLRITSLLFGIVGIAVAARWARISQGRAGAFFTAFAAAFVPLLWWAMREARMYTLLMLLALLALLAIERLRCGSARWAWALLIPAELAALYTHNTGPVIVLWLNALVVLAWLTGRRPLKPHPLPWIGSQGLVGLLWLPYFLTRFTALPSANSGLSNTVDVSLAGLVALWQGFWQTPWERVLFGNEPAWPFALLLFLFAGLAIVRWRAIWWPLASALVLIVGILAGLLVLGNEPHSRYLVVTVPFVAAIYGGAVARFRHTVVRAALVIPPLVLFAANFLYNVSPEAPFQHDDARAIVRSYAETLGPVDTVLAWSYADRYELAYYWNRLGVTAQRVTLPEGASRDDILPLLPRSGDVVINVWYTQRADYRGMLDCLIADGSATPPTVTTVHGMSSRLYRDIASRNLDMESSNVAFGAGANTIAELTARGDLTERPADRALCLPLELRLSAQPPGDLKAAVVVLNDRGDEIARADAVFATADQRTTSALSAGDSVEAYPLLRLPLGTPPGTYPVYLRIYDEVNEPSGYAPQTGQTRGRDVRLGAWTVIPGAEWARGTDEVDIPLIEPVVLSDELSLIGHG